MKKDIHPPYFPNAQIKCACGNVTETGSTKEHLEVEICSACHPFYTGKEKITQTGQVEKFRKRAAKRETKFGPKAKPASAKDSSDAKALADKSAR